MSKRKQQKGVSGNPGKLPMYGNLPVPWVVRRVSERPDMTPRRTGVSIGHEVESGETVRVLEVDGMERDRFGWLWQSSPTAMGGEPEFSQVHPERQRRAMDELRCQVCGQLTRGKSIWIIADEEELPPEGEPILTAHAPVCPKCFGMAMGSCPHLCRAGPPVVTAGRVESAGVVGDVYNMQSKIVRQGRVLDDDKDATMTVARQRLVRLHDWTRFTLDEPPNC